jgi:hypothetical protein
MVLQTGTPLSRQEQCRANGEQNLAGCRNAAPLKKYRGRACPRH